MTAACICLSVCVYGVAVSARRIFEMRDVCRITSIWLLTIANFSPLLGPCGIVGLVDVV